MSVDTIVTVTKTGMVVSFIVSYFLKALVNQLLALVDSLILIVHASIISLNYPVNLANFFTGLFPFITFDILPTTQLYERVFRFNRITDSAISDQFNQVGYQNKSLSINNLNSLYIFFTFGPAMCFVFWFLFKFNLLRRFPHIQDRIDRVVHKVLWNGVLLFCSETYVVVCTVASIGIKDLRLGT